MSAGAEEGMILPGPLVLMVLAVLGSSAEG
jgi:hypothetical protein